MTDLTRRDDSLEESMTFLNKELETLRTTIENYKEDRKIDRSMIVALDLKCKGFEAMEEVREQHSRKMNLWVYGIDFIDEKENTWEVVKAFAKRVLKLDDSFLEQCIIKNTHRVGDKESKDRPIIIAFVRWDDRMKFLKSASGLFSYNAENKTKYGVKTDLALRQESLERNFMKPLEDGGELKRALLLDRVIMTKGKYGCKEKPQRKMIGRQFRFRHGGLSQLLESWGKKLRNT